jgi:hypothetical protein
MKLFNWINPVWIIDTFLTARFDPATAAMVGAGISGGTSLLKGKSLGSSLKNAAIGGALGGAGGYLGGAMGGAGGASPGGIKLGSLGYDATQGSNLLGTLGQGNGINFSSIGSGFGGTSGLPVGGQGILLENNPLLYLDSAANLANPMASNGFLNKIGTAAMDSLKANPFQAAGLGMNIYDRMNAQPQTQAPQLGVIKPQQAGQYQPVLNAMLRKRNPYSLLG